MKKLLILIIICIALSGCDVIKKTNVISEDITIDITKKIEPSDYLVNLKEGQEVSYVLDEENSLLTITVTQQDKEPLVFEKEVKIEYPEIEISDDIVYDFNKEDEFDINALVDVPEGTTIDYTVDEETGQMSITFTKGAYTKTVSKEVEIVEKEVWPKIYEGEGDGYKFTYFIYEDGKIHSQNHTIGIENWWQCEDGYKFDLGSPCENVLDFNGFPSHVETICHGFDMMGNITNTYVKAFDRIQ